MREGVQHSRPGLLVSFSMASFSTSIPGRREARLPLPAPARWLLVLGAQQGAAPLCGICSVSPQTWIFLWHPSAAAGPAALTHGPGYGQAADVQCFVLLDRLPHSIQDIHCQERRVGWDPCPPKKLPGSTPRPTGMHQARPRRSVCWAPHGPAGLRAGGSSARRPWARGEQHSPAVRWQGHGSCSQALCPRGGTLQRQVVSGDGFQRDGVWQPAARYCSLGHDLQETECTGCRTLRGSLMATVDTQTPSLWRVSRALRGETEAHIGRGRAPVPPLTPETTLKHPPVSTRAMRGLCPPMPAGPISPPWSTFCAGPWRCPWQERCSGRRDT